MAVLHAIEERVAVAGDSDDEQLQKAILVLSVALITTAGFVWSASYALLELWRSALFPLAYSVLSIVNTAWFFSSRHYQVFRTVQIAFILVIPVALQWSLGGFVASGAVMLWALLAPVGALLFAGINASIRWFVAYAVLIVLSSLIDVRLGGDATEVAPIVTATFFAMNVTAVSAVMFLLLRYYVGESRKANERSERLIDNMLPRAIARRLKSGESIIADRFNEVTIVFGDIVGFTPISEQLTPEQVVVTMNDLYTAFDDMAAQFGLEKLRTMGDSYVVAAGLPDPRSDHALAGAEMALRMLDELDQHSIEGVGPLQMRIGIHSGSVVAGVIGTAKLTYDMWGDSVNVASRMESHGSPGRIHVSEPVYRALHDRYLFEPRGILDIKGKGEMATYFLIGRQDRKDAQAS